MSTSTLNLDVRSESDVHGFTKEHPITQSSLNITEVAGSYGTYGATKQGDLGVAKHSTLKAAFPETRNVFLPSNKNIKLLVQEELNATRAESFNPDFETVDFNMTRSVPTDAELESLVDKPGRNYPNVMYPSVEGAINNNADADRVTPISQPRNDNYGNEPVTYTASTLYSEIVISSDRGTDGEVMQETIGRYLSSGQ